MYSGARLEVRNCLRICVLLSDLILRIKRIHLQGLNNIYIKARRVVLVSALREARILVGSLVPLPHPVHRVWLSRRSVLGNLNVGLTEQRVVSRTLARLAQREVRELFLALVDDRVAWLVFVAAAIVVVLGCEQDAALVAARAILRPL